MLKNIYAGVLSVVIVLLYVCLSQRENDHEYKKHKTVHVDSFSSHSVLIHKIILALVSVVVDEKANHLRSHFYPHQHNNADI